MQAGPASYTLLLTASARLVPVPALAALPGHSIVVAEGYGAVMFARGKAFSCSRYNVLQGKRLPVPT
jgi:hypothetical protein